MKQPNLKKVQTPQVHQNKKIKRTNICLERMFVLLHFDLKKICRFLRKYELFCCFLFPEFFIPCLCVQRASKLHHGGIVRQRKDGPFFFLQSGYQNFVIRQDLLQVIVGAGFCEALRQFLRTFPGHIDLFKMWVRAELFVIRQRTAVKSSSRLVRYEKA